MFSIKRKLISKYAYVAFQHKQTLNMEGERGRERERDGLDIDEFLRFKLQSSSSYEGRREILISLKEKA